jgi:chromosome segregation ATPase
VWQVKLVQIYTTRVFIFCSRSGVTRRSYLSEAYILALATVKSEVADMKKAYDTVLQEKNVIHNVLIRLKEQRNKINNEYEILKNETDKTIIITLRKEVKNKKIQVKSLQNNIQALEDKSKQSETNELALQSKLNHIIRGT